jgi:uncharacterized protein (UPF0332 family)
MQHNHSGSPKDLAEHRIIVAKEDLEAAESNWELGHLRAANNRAYYSIYHAITAVLALEQQAFKSHKATISYFNQNYVKTDIFPRDIGRRIAKAEEIRHASDYDEFYIVSKTETMQQIETAKKFLAIVMAYVSSKASELST